MTWNHLLGQKLEYPTINIEVPPSALTYVLTYPFNSQNWRSGGRDQILEVWARRL